MSPSLRLIHRGVLVSPDEQAAHGQGVGRGVDVLDLLGRQRPIAEILFLWMMYRSGWASKQGFLKLGIFFLDILLAYLF